MVSHWLQEEASLCSSQAAVHEPKHDLAGKQGAFVLFTEPPPCRNEIQPSSRSAPRGRWAKYLQQKFPAVGQMSRNSPWSRRVWLPPGSDLH